MGYQGRLGLIASLLVTSGAFAKGPAVESVPGEYLVQLKQSVKTSRLSTMANILGGQILRVMPQQNILVLKRSEIENAQAVAKTLSALPQVAVAEPNYIYRINKTPNDPDLSKLWGIKNVGQEDSSKSIGVEGVDVGAEQAWDIQTGSDQVVVAVIDTGLDYTHEDLKENAWTNEAEANGKDGVDDDNNGYIDDIHGYDFVNNDGDPMDDHGHGSHCSGTIGAKGDDGKGIVGVAWNVKIMGVKFLSAEGSGSLEDAIKSIDYATKMGARIMSNSWGGGGFSELLKQSIERANEANAVFTAAAGNHSGNNDESPSYPASYTVPNIISVAAVDNKGQLAYFSCYGRRSVHVGAPGVNVYSSIPGGYDSWSGTSMATPHVSGVAALLLANEPNMKAEEVKERLVRTSKPLSGLRGKVASAGMVNAFFALTNQEAPADPNDPARWVNTQELSVSSEHPYKNKTRNEWEVSIEGANKIALYFSKFETEASYDKVTFYNKAGTKIGELSGGQSDSWSPVIDGDYVKIVLTSDDSVNKYGFDITKAAYK